MKNLRKKLSCLFILAFCTITSMYASKPSFNNVAVHRLQLKVKTNTIKHADTDSPVWVQLNGKDKPFFLNLSEDDREKGKTDVYDILSPNISKIGDIKMIKLGISGNDGWNFKEISLIVNGRAIYKKTFSSAGKWIDGDNKKHKRTFMIGSTPLRYSPNWRYNGYTSRIYRTPFTIPISTMKALVESAVGNTLHDFKKLSWGKKSGTEYVAAKRVSSNRLRFDLDLEYEIKNLPNLEVDVYFDLVFTCNNGVIQTQILNYKTTAYGASKYIYSQLNNLKDILASSCKVLQKAYLDEECRSGLNSVVNLLAFNLNYNVSSNIDLPNVCSRRMSLDHKGNLHLHAPDNTDGSITGID